MKGLVLYHSQEYGNTGKMAEAVAQGLRAAGAEVVAFNTNDAQFDITTFPSYDRVAFGSPDYYSYVAGGLKVFLDDHYIADVREGMKGLKDKPYALFYSHGGGGSVKGPLEDLFKRIGTKVGETVESRGKPTAEVLAGCRALGEELAKAAG